MKCPESIEESPDTVHGRLLESVHISGYSFERASQEFEWLLEENRWKKIGTGYDDIDKFIATIDFSEFKISIEKRKKISKKLADLRATQRAAAKMLGVSQETVRRDVDTNVSKPKPETAPILEKTYDVDTNVSKQPAAPSGAKVAEMAAKAAGKEIKKEAAKEKKSKESNIITAESKKPLSSVCDLRNCSFSELFASGVKPDAVITDPPYPKEFLHLFNGLAECCENAKVPVVAVMSGQSYLPEVMQSLCKHLKYRWTLTYLTPGGQSVQQWPAKINTFWKPVLLFGEANEWLGDVCKSAVNDNDKRFHDWGQSESGFADIVERLTKPGQLVCDPFLGGGTTAVVSLALGRRFVGCDIDIDCVNKTQQRIESVLCRQ